MYEQLVYGKFKIKNKHKHVFYFLIHWHITTEIQYYPETM